MKKLILSIFTVCLAICMCIMPTITRQASAEELSISESTSTSISNIISQTDKSESVVLEQTLEQTIEEDISSEITEPNNIFTRLWSFTKSHYNEILSTLLTACSAIVICLVKRKIKDFLARFNTIKNSVDVNSSAQAQTVGTVNTMIDVFNEQAKTIKELTESNVDMSKKFKYLTSNYTTLLSQNKAMLNILAVVYQGSKNLPQPVKDIVSTYYAEALKVETETNKIENPEV